ncbi:pilus assembly protein PilM [Opitutus sp. GAS368]|uniref:pilus assembly protein PilM n=1 Tax=Opitutus sp. GAS368 TaxID=1882749 RepID=UPI00087B4602|nr:pilus assembly protein PilM [Opitutus sp. GAS368]SDS49922.1 type IV pilus assembly protein PilM [Opitutus sp. GAS368]
MASNRTLILDCGASRTALGAFSRQGRRLRFDHYAVGNLPVHAGSEDHWLEHTRAALATLRAKLKPGGPVVLVLPAHLSLTKLIKTPRVDPAKREKVIRFEAEQSIPYALDDVVWDSVVAAEHDLDLEVLLAAARLEAVEPLCAAVQAAGFEPRLILPSSLATLAAFRLVHDTPKEPALVLNLGGRSTTLLHVEGPRFVARTLALGGQGITQQLAENQDCDPEEAEAIKLSERSGGLTADAMASLATRLAQEITRSVLHFRRQSGMKNPARVHLTGGGARLAGLGEALAAKLKVPVDRLDVLGALEIGPGAARHDAAEHALTLADLAGAATTQLRPGLPLLDLLPPRRRRHENLRRRQPWLAAAAVLAVAALLPPLLHFRAVAAEARHQTDTIERELAPLRERDARNRANLQRFEVIKQEVAQLQGIHDRRVSWLNLLADLQDRMVRVEDVWLERMSVASTPGTPLKLAVSGRMLDKTNPLSKVSPETFNRVKALLASFVESPFVASVEAERFDNEQPGILKFDFVLVANPARPL